ncbi:MAG: tetratricopeptide repeat protein [Verrucomicrobiota bacterium]|jgi:TolA-binding protein
MAFRWRWLLILFALILSGEQLSAAGAKEQRAYAAAVTAFQDEMWGRAETEFAQFIQKYPKSTNAPEAVLLQAQAEFKQGKLAQAIALLDARKAGAGHLADQYVYWIGEAQFQNVDLTNAGETFIALARDFPESSLRLRAVVEAAAARAELAATHAGPGDWPEVGALLQETNGVFQRAAQLDPANELVTRGRLLLAQAALAQKDFGGAAATLASVNPQALEPELGWQLAYLVYQVKLAMGDTNAALAATTNLLQIARLGNDVSLRGESVALHAGLLEQSGLKAEALDAYQENLTNAPVERQRQAVLKITELAVAQGRFSTAEDSLRNFIAQFPDSPAADMALLSLGELHLKDYVADPSATNQLQAASEAFNRFLAAFPNSPLTGKAYLDRGWCGWRAWLAGSTTNSLTDGLTDFEAAAQRLPPSEDLAVARFKMGDALFALTNYAGALENYRAVLDDFTNFPAVARALGDRALYQSLRACMELTNTAGAEDTMERILKLYPASEETGNSLLLMGEYLADLSQPTNALAVFQRFEAILPHSPLRPQVDLAIAHACEQEQNWPTAIEKYEKWLTDFPTNALRPQADYALASANYQAGNETNAFILFTNFVAQFPTNDLTPLAQWWVADHFFHAGLYPDAEKNYKFIFQNFPPNDLSYPARMMAGRAAVARQGYSDASDYFTKLEEDTNCPKELRVQATFAYGTVLMRMDSTVTNNPLANFQLATNVFNQICQLYSTNELGALAWGEIGDCDLQLANYDAATNAYAQVVNSPFPNIAARSQAQIGLGLALEKKAAAAAGGDQKVLRELALKNYLDVFYENNLRNDEQADAFWTKKAGLQALPLIEGLGESPPEDFFNRMENWLPQLKDSLEKTRNALPAAKS